MTEEPRRLPGSSSGSGPVDRDRLDRALDRLIRGAPDPAPPADLARRILAATAAVPQLPPVPVAGRPLAGLRLRAVAAAFALVAAVGFAVGWVEPLLIGEAQAVDVTPFVLGSDLEIDL